MKNIILLLCVCISALAPAQKSLKTAVSKITEGKKAIIAVSVQGIDFPFEFHNENAETKLPMLSVYKFHIAAAALHLVDRGQLSLEQKVFIKKSDLLENTWSPIREKYPDGNIDMPLSELIRYTVAESDNNSCDILLRLIGGEKTVQNFMDARKVKNFQIRFNEEMMHKGPQYIYPNNTTAHSMSTLLKNFHRGKILSKKSTAFLLATMSGTSTGANKLKEQLPAGTVAHKTGSSGTDSKGFTIAENDAGIVQLPDGRHYAITVFVNDSTEDASTNTKLISDISKAVWDLLIKK